MRIIERGTPKAKYPWVGIWKCLNCKSVAEFTESDVNGTMDGHAGPKWSESQREGEGMSAYCPVCEGRTSWIRHSLRRIPRGSEGQAYT